MNPKQDNQLQAKKYFDVAPPGKTPASPSSRPVVGGPSVKDFDFADKPADASLSKFGGQSDDYNKPDSEDFEMSSQPEAPSKNRLDLDSESTNDDISQVQSELGKPGEHEGTAFKPDNYETSSPTEDGGENADEESSTDNDQPDLLSEPEEEPSNTQDYNREPSEPKETSSKKDSKKAENRKKTNSSKVPKEERYKSTDRPSEPTQPMPINTGQMVVSQHTGSGAIWAELFALLVIILLLAGILNLLLDAELIALDGVPHTDLFSE